MGQWISVENHEMTAKSNSSGLSCFTVKPIASKSTDEFEGPFKPAKTLKQGSVLDLLKSPGENLCIYLLYIEKPTGILE